MTIASASSGNGCFAPAHQSYQPLPIAKSLHLFLTPAFYCLLQHRFSFGLGHGRIPGLPPLFCQFEGHSVSWAYDFEQCGLEGGVRSVGRRLDCSDFGGGLSSRPFYIALGTWALSSRGDERCTLALGFSYRLDPHSIVPFKGSFVSVFVLIQWFVIVIAYAFKPAFWNCY